MSLAEFKDYLSVKPELARIGAVICDYLAGHHLGMRLRARDVAHFTRLDEPSVNGLFRILVRHGVLEPGTVPVCPNDECQEAFLTVSNDGELHCDLCDQLFFKEETKMKEVHVLQEIPAHSEVVTAAMAKSSSTSAFLHPRSHAWDANFVQQEAIVASNQLRNIQFEEIHKRLERFGFAIVRITAQPPSTELLKAAINYVGPPIENQNGSIGWFKTLTPKPDGPQGSGEVITDLDFHVDGTQDREQPAMLAFQYINEPDFGADSRFVDMAKVLADMEPGLREKVLVALSRPDAATCAKKGLSWTGPIVELKTQHGDNAFGVRIRFDDVMKVHPESQWAYDTLKAFANDPKYCLEFLPRKGDIIIFDNLRLLHARSRVGGQATRQHNRVWIKELTPQARLEIDLGIRTTDIRLLSMIKARNGDR